MVTAIFYWYFFDYRCANETIVAQDSKILELQETVSKANASLTSLQKESVAMQTTLDLERKERKRAQDLYRDISETLSKLQNEHQVYILSRIFQSGTIYKQFLIHFD